MATDDAEAVFSAQFLARARRDNPNFDREQRLIQAAMRDCAIAYLWNPYAASHEFEYDRWGTTIYAGIDEEERIARVVFRGTDQLIDWVVNLAFVPLRLDHPLAHSGFVAAWKLAKRRFAPWLRAHADRFDRVVITGHSLGGAMALACAYELQSEGFEVDRCITVGAPRLYTAQSAWDVGQVLEGRLIRVVKHDDLVPKIPPEFLGYRHLGPESKYVGELLGKREPDPFPGLSRRLAAAWQTLSDRGARVRCWVREHTGMDMDAQLVAYLLVLVASLGGVFSLLVASLEVSLLAVSYFTGFLVALSGAIVGVCAHRSGRYAATGAASCVLEEWQLHHLRPIASAQVCEPAGDGSVWINIPVELSPRHGDDRKRRLLRNFRRKFGDSAFRTAVGKGIRSDKIFELDTETRAPLSVCPLDARLAAVCVALRLFGYSPAELDGMLSDGVIRRPLQWDRYYARGRDGEGSAHPDAPSNPDAGRCGGAAPDASPGQATPFDGPEG